jgi:lipoate-protein ligase A
VKILDRTFPTAAENLACDEALLDWRDGEGGDAILRFWEPKEYFVVVGYANQVSLEVNVAACRENGISILRRCSGGGTVLQGAGCLNYSLILNIASQYALQSISSANRFIMERNRAALEREIRSQKPEIEVTVNGHTDLAINEPRSKIKKFSGNAQRRKKHFLLFHGTFLLKFDIPLIEKFLPMPSKQPDYREQRRHSDFLTNLGVSTDSVKKALRSAWNADEPLENFPNECVMLLAGDKYVTAGWNSKF